MASNQKIAVYAGTFDPITLGHLDIVERAARVFDKVYIAVATSTHKQALFSSDQRVSMIKDALSNLELKDLSAEVKVDSFDGLLVEYVRSVGGNVIVRGLRAVADYEYEYRIALVNQKLAPEIETVSFMASGNNSFINSSIVREVAKYGGDVSSLVPTNVSERLKDFFSSK